MRKIALAGVLIASCVTACGGSSSDPTASTTSAAPTPVPIATAEGKPQLVFTGPDVASPTGTQDLYIVQTDGTRLRKLVPDGFPRFLPHFSPDGRSIIYSKFTQAGYGSPSARSEIGLFDLATGTERLLTHGGFAVQGIWSPDGRRIAFGTLTNDGIWMMNANGSGQHRIAQPTRTPDDLQWGDYLWSSDNWIYFSVTQNIGDCFKVRMDRMRPDGTQRTKIDDGGPNCTPLGLEQSGDADPGISPDGKFLYSSRGLPRTVPGRPELTVRHLVRIETTPWVRGKLETDLSTGRTADCISGVPKVSADNTRIALFVFCSNDLAHIGVHVTDLAGSQYRFVARGFGPDWNPAARATTGREGEGRK